MRKRIVFYLNGSRHEVDAETALLTVADYLRNTGHGAAADRLTGTKIACSEGDCGACTVLVGSIDAPGQPLVYRSIDSCIAFVFQMDGKHVVTVEGLARNDGLTAIQSAMVDCHGSQCGFCTPGFVMAMHSLVESHCGGDGPVSAELPEEDVRLALSGNLCRCTGYLQILEAAASVDATKVLGINDLFQDSKISRDLDALNQESVLAWGGAGQAEPAVAIPRTVDDLLRMRNELPKARLVAGATDLGVQYNHGRFVPRQIISTAQVLELDCVAYQGSSLMIGAAATWQQIDEFIQSELPEYHKVLERFGSPQVRHAGTLAGNLANASPIADSIPFHFVAESVIHVASQRGNRKIPIGEFYRGYKDIDLEPDEVIQFVDTPMPGDGTAVKLYKISKRRDMDISAVTAAFWLELDGGKICEARIAFGGVGPVVARLPNVEATLRDASFTLEVMQQAGRLARNQVTPLSDVRGSADYRLQLVENLFVKCYHDLAPLTTTKVT